MTGKKVDFRLAILADIHANPIALNAVLADLALQGGADGFVVLGDLAAIGPAPLPVLDRLASLPNLTAAHGNTDRYLLEGNFPNPSPAEMQDAERMARILGMARGFAWTAGALTTHGWMDWLAKLPLEQRLALPDGTRLLAVHAAPGADDDVSIYPTHDAAHVFPLMVGCQADLVFVGHIHYPQDRQVASVRLVNPGSVSNPLHPDGRARYTLLEAGGWGWRLMHHAVTYDHQAVIDLTLKVKHPMSGYIIDYMLGRVLPPWLK